MFTQKCVVLWMICPALTCLPRQKSTSGGSSESDVKELAVSALISPSDSMAMTATPVANCDAVCRNARVSIAMTSVESAALQLPGLFLPLRHEPEHVLLRRLRSEGLSPANRLAAQHW